MFSTIVAGAIVPMPILGKKAMPSTTPIILTAETILFVLGEIYTRMAYNRWFYEFTEDNLKLERGIIWKRYSNISYERIQNIDITRGILARLFNFSSVNIQTAGYTGARGATSEGYIPAVSTQHAEEIRDFITKKISHKRTQEL